MKVDILNIEGKSTGRKIDLPDDVFSAEPNDHAIYLAVKQYNASLRQGTHSAKEKSQLSGSTRKLHKQKGTGGSRKGSIKNPIFRGGARIFGPRPRVYGFRLNKKVKTLAKNSALSYKVREKNLIVLEDIKIETPRTKEFLKMLENLKVSDKKILLVTADKNKNVELSARNVTNAEVLVKDSVNTYNILNAQCLLLTEGTVKAFSEAPVEKVEK